MSREVKTNFYLEILRKWVERRRKGETNVPKENLASPQMENPVWKQESPHLRRRNAGDMCMWGPYAHMCIAVSLAPNGLYTISPNLPMGAFHLVLLRLPGGRVRSVDLWLPWPDLSSCWIFSYQALIFVSTKCVLVGLGPKVTSSNPVSGFIISQELLLDLKNSLGDVLPSWPASN